MLYPLSYGGATRDERGSGGRIRHPELYRTSAGHSDGRPRLGGPDRRGAGSSVGGRIGAGHRVLADGIGSDAGNHPVGRCSGEGERPTMYVRKFTGWRQSQSLIQSYSEER